MLDLLLRLAEPVALSLAAFAAFALVWATRRVPDVLAQLLALAVLAADAWVRYAKTTEGTADDAAAALLAKMAREVLKRYADDEGQKPPGRG